jgi:hypothetical protein
MADLFDLINHLEESRLSHEVRLMALYAIIAPPGPEDSPTNIALAAAIQTEFPGNFYKIADGQFLVVVDKLTTNQIVEKLNFREGKLGRALVARIETYNGWHSRDLWEWIRNQTNPAPAPAPDDPKAL